MKSDERELLIRVDQRLNDIVEQNTKEHEQLMKALNVQQAICNKRPQECEKKYAHGKVVFWILGFMLVGMISLAGITSKNSVDIGKIQACQAQELIIE